MDSLNYQPSQEVFLRLDNQIRHANIPYPTHTTYSGGIAVGKLFSFPFQAGFAKLNVYVFELLSCNENRFDGAISVRTFKIL